MSQRLPLNSLILKYLQRLHVLLAANIVTNVGHYGFSVFVKFGPEASVSICRKRHKTDSSH